LFLLAFLTCVIEVIDVIGTFAFAHWRLVEASVAVWRSVSTNHQFVGATSA
jgi:hypothetical protein